MARRLGPTHWLGATALLLLAHADARAYEVFLDTGDGPVMQLKDRSTWANVADRLDGLLFNGAGFGANHVSGKDTLEILNQFANGRTILEVGFGDKEPATNKERFNLGGMGLLKKSKVNVTHVFGWDERNADSILTVDQGKALKRDLPGLKVVTNFRSWPNPRGMDRIKALYQAQAIDAHCHEFQTAYPESFMRNDMMPAVKWAVENKRHYIMLLPPAKATGPDQPRDYVKEIRHLATLVREAAGTEGMSRKDQIWFILAQYAYRDSQLPFSSDQPSSVTGYTIGLFGAAEWLLDHKDAFSRPKGTGLQAHYFANATNSGKPVADQIDGHLDFAWSAAPAKDVPANQFSAWWTGMIEPRYSENYTISVQFSGLVRVWVNHRLLIDELKTGIGSAEGQIELTAGEPADIHIQYSKRMNTGAVLRLAWSSTKQKSEIIPTACLTPGELPTPKTKPTVHAEPVPAAVAATPAAPAQGSASPETRQVYAEKLKARVREVLAAKRFPSFQVQQPPSKAAIRALNASDELQVRLDVGLETPIKWSALSASELRSLALSMAETENTPQDHALAGFFLFDAGLGEKAEAQLAKAGDQAATVRAAFATNGR